MPRSLISQLNPHHSPYRIESSQCSDDFKSKFPAGLIIVVKSEILENTWYSCCKHTFPLNMCAASFVFMTTSSCKQNGRSERRCKNHIKTLFWFPSRFPIQCEPAPKNNDPCLSCAACLFCPLCKHLSFFIRWNTVELWQPSFYSQSQHVIFISLLTAPSAEPPQNM